VLLPTPIQAGDPVTGTATDPNGNTSELSPGIAFVLAPGLGGPGDTQLQGLQGQLFDPAATVTVGGNPVAVTVQLPTLIRFVGPALAPGEVYDVTVTNPSGLSGTIYNAYVSRFNDVLDSSLFDDAISRLVAGEITVGIGGGNYGPNNNVTRQQMAVFVLKAKYGVCYTPPPCVQVFDDVPCGSVFAVWVNQFAAEGITGGCGGNNFCPVNPVRRDQMAVFLLKGKYGANFKPAPCANLFDDVDCPGPFADWIERLSAEGITGGCGGNNYCPLNNNTRAQMAAFIVRTFTLP
jgi:S-layer homology domain